MNKRRRWKAKARRRNVRLWSRRARAVTVSDEFMRAAMIHTPELLRESLFDISPYMAAAEP